MAASRSNNSDFVHHLAGSEFNHSAISHNDDRSSGRKAMSLLPDSSSDPNRTPSRNGSLRCMPLSNSNSSTHFGQNSLGMSSASATPTTTTSVGLEDVDHFDVTETSPNCHGVKGKSGHKVARVMQAFADAQLHEAFESSLRTGLNFDYTKSTTSNSYSVPVKSARSTISSSTSAGNYCGHINLSPFPYNDTDETSHETDLFSGDDEDESDSACIDAVGKEKRTKAFVSIIGNDKNSSHTEGMHITGSRRKSENAEVVDVMAYLQKMQRGSLVQSFGCLLAVDEKSFSLVAFSENASSMLIVNSATRKLSECQETTGDSKASSRIHGTAVPVPPAWFRNIFKRDTRVNQTSGHGEAMEILDREEMPNDEDKLTLPHLQEDTKRVNASGNARPRRWKDLISLPVALFATPFTRCHSVEIIKPKNTSEPTPHFGVRNQGRWRSILQKRRPRTSSLECRSLAATKQAEALKERMLKIEFGMDIRQILTNESATSLELASAAHDVSMMNPVLVESSNGRPFYAILHRNIESGLLLVDLEPVSHSDPVLSGAGALHSHKLAAKAIAHLQKLPPGNLVHLCKILVHQVRELTGYDRVMAYKFHADDHGEVIAEEVREDMEPYLGLHYPATDIPQAARFLFMKNRVRIIENCNSEPVTILHDESVLTQPISLTASTLRAVHGCHAQYMRNMGTDASLVFAVLINDTENPASAGMTPSRPETGKKLWGLVVCHHEKPRHIAFPLRLACEFLMQVFSLQVNGELEIAAQFKETEMLRTQTLLCELLLREAPLGIVSYSPNIKDLLKCDGAALLYGGQLYALGVTPSELHIRKIIEWLDTEHANSSGMSTDSLAEAGFPFAEELGGSICGMASARLLAGDFLFWFRSHVEKAVRWSGARNESAEKDDVKRMGPRTSFAAFLEVVKRRSEPWEDLEMDAAHSLQTILLSRLTSFNESDLSVMAAHRLEEREADAISQTESEMARLLDSASVPILALDHDGCISGWNSKIAELTGMATMDALGRSLVKELICQESVDVVGQALYLAFQGHETKKLEMQLRRWGPRIDGSDVVTLEVNAFSSHGADDQIVGVCLFGQDVTRKRAVERKFTKLQGDYTAIVRSQNSIIPPIFAIDDFGCVVEWNPAMEKVSRVSRQDAVGRILLGGLFSSASSLSHIPSCRVKADNMIKMQIILNKALSGSDTERYPVTFLDAQGNLVEALLTVHSRNGPEEGSAKVPAGVFCFLHIASVELQRALILQKAAEDAAETTSKAVAYIRQEMNGPIDGLDFFLESFKQSETSLHGSEEVLRNTISPMLAELLSTTGACQRQLKNVVGDMDIGSIQDGFVAFEFEPVDMMEVVRAVVSQGRANAPPTVEVLEGIAPESLPTLHDCGPVYGDAPRIQQVLSKLLTTAIKFVPLEGWVRFQVTSDSRSLFRHERFVNFEFRIIHVGHGVPISLLEEMSGKGAEKQKREEGISLNACRSILNSMGGRVGYSREEGRSTFIVHFCLPVRKK